ncbi:MAG: hypothetical protein ACTSR3_12175 [Candidatus Helarchaeota archaeon]
MNRIKPSIRRFIGKYPFLYYSIASKMNPRIRRLGVNRMTDLVITGYPRSGNSFAVLAFQHAQRMDVNVAHHLHVPAQVIRGVKLKIPTLVLIRKPQNAILSVLLRQPQMLPAEAIKNYIWFYKTIFKFRNSIVIGTFEQIIEDYGKVIKRINNKFGTRFSIFKHTEKNVKNVFNQIEEINRKEGQGLEEQIARPSDYKNKLKEMKMEILKGKEIKPLICKAERIYCDFICGQNS